MYIDDPKIELSYLAHLSCCVISKAIRDYHKGIKKQPIHDYFTFVRGKINDIHGQDAIDWFCDRNDSALSFPICCFLIERALANKTVVAKARKYIKNGLLFDPDVLREKIFKDPAEMQQVFKELAHKFGHEDVRTDIDEDFEASVKEERKCVTPLDSDLLISEYLSSEKGADSMSGFFEELEIAAVG